MGPASELSPELSPKLSHELTRLERDGVIDARSSRAAGIYCTLSAGSIIEVRGEGDQLARIEALRRVRGLERATAARVGIIGIGVVRAICIGGGTAASIARDHGFTRGDRPDLGDARRAHVLIRVSFDALAQAVMGERSRPPPVEEDEIPVGVIVGAPVDGRTKRRAIPRA